MKLSELHKAGELPERAYDKNGNIKVGYVGTDLSAEVVSGYTSFFLGIRSIIENIVMNVKYTDSGAEAAGVGDAAKALIKKGCVIIGQHSAAKDIAVAVQEEYKKGTLCYSVGYGIDMSEAAPDAGLTSSAANWEIYYKYVMECMINGTEIAIDWSKGFTDNAVAVTEFGPQCAEGTAQHVGAVVSALKNNQLHVFDTGRFTVDGEAIDSYYIDLNGDAVKDEGDGNAQVIGDGYFHESELRSAPYFDIKIDGITELN